MLRKQVHQLIDQFPPEKLASLLAVIQDYKTYDSYVPRLDGLPVYDMKNPIHTKILLSKHTNPKPALSLARKEL